MMAITVPAQLVVAVQLIVVALLAAGPPLVFLRYYARKLGERFDRTKWPDDVTSAAYTPTGIVMLYLIVLTVGLSGLCP